MILLIFLFKAQYKKVRLLLHFGTFLLHLSCHNKKNIRVKVYRFSCSIYFHAVAENAINVHSYDTKFKKISNFSDLCVFTLIYNRMILLCIHC